MNKKMIAVLTASMLVMALPMTVLAGDSSDWANYSPSLTVPSAPAADTPAQGNTAAPADDKKPADKAEDKKPAEAPAQSSSSASSNAVDSASVSASIVNADGSKASVSLEQLSKGTDAAINDALKKAADDGKASDALKAFATDAVQKDELVTKLEEAISGGARAKTIGSFSVAGSGKDTNGNVIATPGEYTGSASADALFILTSVDSDGSVERVMGVLIPVSDKKKNDHKMLYGAFQGTPETITVTVVE